MNLYTMKKAYGPVHEKEMDTSSKRCIMLQNVKLQMRLCFGLLYLKNTKLISYMLFYKLIHL